MLVVNLLITIAIILLLIMVVKMHPALSLFLGALYMGTPAVLAVWRRSPPSPPTSAP